MMPSSRRYKWPRQIATLLLILMFLGEAALVGLGIYDTMNQRPEGLWLVVVGALMFPISVFLYLILMVMLKHESNSFRVYDAMVDLIALAETFKAPVRSIADDIRISDAARSLAHRDEEITALRSAIHDEINRANWGLADILVNQMEERFGYQEEAERLREEINEIRNIAIETKVEQVLVHIANLLDSSQWQLARQEIDRLGRIFPNDERVRDLPLVLERRMENHKLALLDEWQAVVGRREVDRAVELLHQLDQHLTPEEAEQLRNDAREILKDQLVNLGVQFKLAVSDRRWKDALEIGVEIVEERPNSKMAEEVRQMLPKLRERAGMNADAVVIDQRPGHA